MKTFTHPARRSMSLQVALDTVNNSDYLGDTIIDTVYNYDVFGACTSWLRAVDPQKLIETRIVGVDGRSQHGYILILIEFPPDIYGGHEGPGFDDKLKNNGHCWWVTGGRRRTS